MIRLRNALKRRTFREVLVDVSMMGILVLNLTLIVVDTLFASALVQELGRAWVPRATAWYARIIHRNFLLIDMGFVAVFVSELCLRWLLAIHRRTYAKWFFYPIVHWYDVVGCLPIDSFRFFRVFRVASILHRLQRLQLIDIRRWYVYTLFVKYRRIVVEEVSDRVVVNVLGEVQRELTAHHPVADRIVQEAIAPRKTEITEMVVARLQQHLAETLTQHRHDIRQYLDALIAAGFRSSQETEQFEKIPLLGKVAIGSIEQAVKEIVAGLSLKLQADVQTVGPSSLAAVLDQALSASLSRRDTQLSALLQEIVLHALDIVKEQVQVQQWKLREAEEKEAMKA